MREKRPGCELSGRCVFPEGYPHPQSEDKGWYVEGDMIISTGTFTAIRSRSVHQDRNRTVGRQGAVQVLLDADRRRRETKEKVPAGDRYGSTTQRNILTYYAHNKRSAVSMPEAGRQNRHRGRTGLNATEVRHPPAPDAPDVKDGGPSVDRLACFHCRFQ